MDKRRPQAVFCASTRPLSAALYRTVCADKPDERAPLPRTARSMRQASNCAFERFELSRPERALSSLREGARRRQLILPGYAFRLVCFETFFRKSSIGRTLPSALFARSIPSGHAPFALAHKKSRCAYLHQPFKVPATRRIGAPIPARNSHHPAPDIMRRQSEGLSVPCRARAIRSERRSRFRIAREFRRINIAPLKPDIAAEISP